MKVGGKMKIKKMLRDKIPRWLIAWTYKISRVNVGYIANGRIWSDIRLCVTLQL